MTSKFTRGLAKSSLGGDVCAFSEMLDHMSMLREFFGHFKNLYSGMAGLEDCESLFTHLKKKLIAAKFLERHVSVTQQAIEIQELGDVYWAPEREIRADGLTELHSGIPPLLRFTKSGSYKSRSATNLIS